MTPEIGKVGYKGNSPEAMKLTGYSAWITPEGNLYAVEYHSHSQFAEHVLGDITGGMRLMQDHVHISGGRVDRPYREMTQSQLDRLFDIISHYQSNVDPFDTMLVWQCKNAIKQQEDGVAA